MECSRCAKRTRREELKSFWRQVSNEDKRQFATGSAALAGGAAGWGVTGLLGGLVGLFLGGCVGGIAGLLRYRETTDRLTAEPETVAGRPISR